MKPRGYVPPYVHTHVSKAVTLLCLRYSDDSLLATVIAPACDDGSAFLAHFILWHPLSVFTRFER